MIQELLGGTAMDQQQLKCAGANAANHHHASLPMVLQPISSNPSPTSSSTSSRSSTQRSPSATSSPAQAPPGPEQAPLRCPRCNSSNTKFCYYNNYNLTQPRHFCKTCRRYWTKGGALRNVPIGGGCRKPRPMPAPVAKAQPSSCKSMLGVGTAPNLGLGMGVGSGGPMSWASGPQAATAQLMALLNSARAGYGGSNVHRLLGLDTMGQLQVLPGSPNGMSPSLWPPQPTHRSTMPPPPMHLDSHLGMGSLGLGQGQGQGHHDLLSGLGLKPPSSSQSQLAASYYSDQLNAVVSNGSAVRPPAYDSPASSYPCTTAMCSLPPSASPVSAAPPSHTVGMDHQGPVTSLAPQEMHYWSGGPASMSMSMAWPDLPTLNGTFP